MSCLRWLWLSVLFETFAVAPLAADNILSVTAKADCNGGGWGFLGGPIYGTAWTQTGSYSNVSVVVVVNNLLSDGSAITAYLTNQIGPGTTTANEIGHGTFVLPANGNPGAAKSSNAAIFQGLNLGPGDYYLTLYAANPPAIAGTWCFASPATVTTGSGVTQKGDFEGTTFAPAYPPATPVSFPSTNVEVSVSGTPGTPPAPAQTGTISVNSNLLNATFTLKPAISGAPSSGPYAVTINNAPVGQYSMAFGDVQGYFTPSVPPQTLTAGGTISFNGQYVVAASAVSVILFDATQLTQSPSLNPRATFAYTDSQGISHGYNSFAVQGSGALDGNGNLLSFNNTAFQLSVQTEGSGSLMTLTVPSGGDKSCHCLVGDQIAGPNLASGGTLQFLIPFGVTVNKIDGDNADFGMWNSPVRQAFACALRVGVDSTMGYVFGIFYTGFQLGECFGGLFSQPSCNIVYPILNDQSMPCIADPSNNSLFGDNALNTHQIRTIRWKPSGDGKLLSKIQFHVDQTPTQVIGLIQQQGITVYVTTPIGDFWLDNFH